MIQVSINDSLVREALNRLLSTSQNLRPIMLGIGDILKESTQKRFVTATDPDGNAWLLNSVLSTLLYKDGDLPLTDSGTLGNQINVRLLDSNTVAVGSELEYAAMMQFGGTKAEFPQLWGDVPARPFLGMSDQDEADILEMIVDYIEEQIT